MAHGNSRLLLWRFRNHPSQVEPARLCTRTICQKAKQGWGYNSEAKHLSRVNEAFHSIPCTTEQEKGGGRIGKREGRRVDFQRLFTFICLFFIIFVWVLHVCKCIICMSGVHGGQKWSDPLELELQRIVRHYVAARNWTWIFNKSYRCFYHWSISPALD